MPIGPTMNLCWGVRFSGSVTPVVYVQATYAPNATPMQATDSLENVTNSHGELYWQDTANQVVWVKLRAPGLAPEPPAGQELEDDFLYRSYRLHIVAP